MSDELVFQPRPGRHERQLKRRYRNPLFGERQTLSLDELKVARVEDQNELEVYIKDLKALFDDAAKMEAHVESDVVLSLKERCDKLFEQGNGLGVDLDKELDALQRLTQVIMKVVWQGAGNDAQARSELEQEEQARVEHYRLLAFPLIADLLSPESVIKEEDLLPVLLSEDEQEVREALRLFDPAQRQALLDQAQSLLAGLEQDAAAYEERLALFLEGVSF